jgi:hypothetical protein
MILMKLGEEYKLYSHDSCIATTQESPHKKLSKQNCDEIFGVVDIDKLAKEETRKYLPGCPENIMNFIAHERFFKIAFEQALELNKDKLFTVEDIANAINKAREGIVITRISEWETEKEFEYTESEIIQSLQQPTEIEVEFEMEVVPVHNGITTHEGLIHKVDENGCIVLRKL